MPKILFDSKITLQSFHYSDNNSEKIEKELKKLELFTRYDFKCYESSNEYRFELNIKNLDQSE